MSDCISAVSTPRGTGGIAVIRVSGDNTLKIADKFFKPFHSPKPSEMKGYTCAYGEVYNGNGEKVDNGVLTVFRAPNSYTGEDVVEVSCHGGMYVTQAVLRATFDAGCRPAEAGEFTKRAFMNGKLSLEAAEGVMDVISAKSDAELKIAKIMQTGIAYQNIQSLKADLTEILGKLAVWADYPDDDIPEIDHATLIPMLENILEKMKKTYKTYDYGQRIKEGIPTVILGKPNVGKSTLFNLLTGQQRSIVTEIAGTTRDVIEETVQLGDVSLRLWDTAGIRETDDKIEKIGVENALGKIDEAELVLLLFDSTEPFDVESTSIDKLKDKTVVAIINKSDLNSSYDISTIKNITPYVVSISAKNQTGIDDFEQLLKKLYFSDEITAENGWIANDRQRNDLKLSMDAVEKALNLAKRGEFLDIITVELDDALDNLLKITGEKTTDTVVNEVFSKFCVGK